MARPPLKYSPSRRNIKALWPIHKEILRLALQGMKPKDIASYLGIRVTTVSYTINSDLGRARLNELQSARDDSAVTISKRITDLLPASIEVLKNTLYNNDDDDVDVPIHLRLRAAQMVMDRTGYGPQSKSSVDIKHTHGLSKETIKELKRRAIESGIRTGNIIEGEVVVEEN